MTMTPMTTVADRRDGKAEVIEATPEDMETATVMM